MRAYTRVVSALLALLALRASSEAAPTSNEPPIRCIGTKPAAVCDSGGLLSRREINRLLRAASRLARMRCGSVMIIVGARQMPSDNDDSGESCMLKIHAYDVSVSGRVFVAAERALAQRRLVTRISAGWSTANAIIETLRALSLPQQNDVVNNRRHRRRRWIGCGVLIFLMVVWSGCRGCIAATYLRPYYERCRRALKRLDDVRARTRALKFPSNVCPICLDVLPSASNPPIATPLAPLTNTIYSTHHMRRNTRRSRALLIDDSNSEHSFDSNSASSTDDDSKRRTLPCGHGKFQSFVVTLSLNYF